MGAFRKNSEPIGDRERERESGRISEKFRTYRRQREREQALFAELPNWFFSDQNLKIWFFYNLNGFGLVLVFWGKSFYSSSAVLL